MEQPASLTWRTSSYSGSNGGNCIQVATTSRAIAVRDSKDPAGPILEFSSTRWRQFADRLKASQAAV
jgi:hypothetical protein